MKRIIITLALAAAAAISASAQIGVGAGYQGKKYSDGDDSYSVGGVYVGANYNYVLDQSLAVSLGAVVNFLSGDQGGATIKEFNLGIPVLANYTVTLAEGFNLVPFLGPTFSIGLSDKVESSGVSINLYDKDVDIAKRFDILVGGGVALDVMDIIRISVGYNKGLLNRIKESDDSVTTGGFHFGVAYLF
ncbi:MAG: outer membrane beta-barrel protein [Bacteroidales bacterium]|nr:outer membrane beta-barrel protein [Bacteroidales bacterium]